MSLAKSSTSLPDQNQSTRAFSHKPEILNRSADYEQTSSGIVKVEPMELDHTISSPRISSESNSLLPESSSSLASKYHEKKSQDLNVSDTNPETVSQSNRVEQSFSKSMESDSEIHVLDISNNLDTPLDDTIEDSVEIEDIDAPNDLNSKKRKFIHDTSVIPKKVYIYIYICVCACASLIVANYIYL